MEEGRSAFKILTGKPTGGLGVDGRTILEWTLKGMGGIGLIRLRILIIGEPL